MSESRFSKRLRDSLKPFGFDFYRIESHATCPGISDIHWLFTGGYGGWIETKQVSREPAKVPYEPQQAPWLQSYARAGGRSCTLIHVMKTDEVIFVPGRESVVAAGKLRDALGARRVNLREQGAWKRVAQLVLGA